MRARLSVRSSLIFLPALLLACSSSSGGGGATTSADAGGDGATTPGFVAHFAVPASGTPDVFDIPFPSDVWLAADGTVNIPAGKQAVTGSSGLLRVAPVPNGAQYLSDSFAKTHGYGVYAGALFALDGGRPDATKLPTGKPTDCTDKTAVVALFDLDSGTPVPCQAAFHDDSDTATGRLGTTPTLNVRPARGVVLPEGHHIAAVLTSGVVDTSGNPLGASSDFAALRDGTRSSALQMTYGAAVDAVASKMGIAKSSIVSAAVYTTGNVTSDLRQARELAAATPVPKINWDAASTKPVAPAKFTSVTPLPMGWNASLDDLLGKPAKLADGSDDPNYDDGNPGTAHDAIGALGTAEFDAPNFLIDVGSQTYADPTHGTFFHDASGKLAINPAKPTNKIWVTFSIPKGTMPTAGWPVVIMQHGLAGQRSDIFEMANTFNKQGWAVASIEIVLHGTRAADANARGDSQNDNARSTTKYNGPDGFSDKGSDGSNAQPNDFFGSLFRIAAMRDQFRQTAIDHTTLVRLLGSSPTLDGLAIGGATPKIDGTKIAYCGDSLGGITGAITAGIEPNVSAFVLNVPGAGMLSEVGANSAQISQLLGGAANLYFGLSGVQLPPEQALVQMFQHIMDGGDPIAVAGTVEHPIAIGGSTPKPRNVIIHEVLVDEIVPNESTEALARAMGLPVVAPHEPAASLLASFSDVDGASITNVPVSGATAFMVQLYPASHGYDMYGASATREFSAHRPVWNDPGGGPPFPKLAKPLSFPSPYLSVQALDTAFIADAFAGKVPTAKWTTAPAPVTDG